MKLTISKSLLLLWAIVACSGLFAATYTVTSNADNGANTLRQAIINANTNPGLDIIEFNFAVPTTITLTACQQQITGPVTINGYSNPGAGAGNLMVEVISPAGCRGFDFAAGSDGSTIRGIVISGGTTGIYLNNSDSHTVTGNYVGVNMAGTAIATSRPQNGIHAYYSDNSTIGGTGGQIDRNIVSGATDSGIRLQFSTNVVIINNYVGTDVTGNVDLGNTSHGIYGYDNSHNPRVGGTTTAERNLVSGNNSHGIFFYSCTSPVIKGNIIGIGLDGSTKLGNGASGISCEYTGATQIGGLTVAERNYCSNNGSFGIVIRWADNSVIEGNWIGVDMATGLLDHGNYDAAITVTVSADVRIGGSVAGSGNICSASGNPGTGADGISIWQTSPRPIIKGNIIGLGADGTTPLSNHGHGIECLTCNDGIIGGTTALERNLVAASFNVGLQLVNSPGLTVLGNYVGTDVTGLLDRGGSEVGISVSNSANVTVGGTVAGAGNVISGNAQSGMIISGSSSGTIVKGNIVGLGSDGVTSIRNDQFGIRISGNAAHNCIVGGATALERNIISSNGTNTSHHGLSVEGGTTGHTITNNYIGLDITGSIAKGNTGNGINVNSSDNFVINNNVVASNGADGVELINSDLLTLTGNYIGTNAAGTGSFGNGSEGLRFSGTCLDNTIGGSEANANIIANNNGTAGVLLESSSQRNEITFNSIYCNAGLGIDLQSTANESVAAPGITTSSANSISGSGTNGNTIHVYRNVKGDGGVKCNCEGEIYLGTAVVSGGTWTVIHNLGLSASDASSVTATQTTPNGSTSEFTPCTSPLPVEYIYFNAFKNKDFTVTISWATSNERNNSHFLVQRSPTGEDFATIGIQPGAGNSDVTIHYSMIDHQPYQGENYYRLLQKDIDGKISFTDIKLVEFNDDKISVVPDKNGFTILNPSGKDQEIRYSLYTVSGATVVESLVNIPEGATAVNISLNVSPALYLVQVTGENDIVTEKVKLGE